MRLGQKPRLIAQYTGDLSDVKPASLAEIREAFNTYTCQQCGRPQPHTSRAVHLCPAALPGDDFIAMTCDCCADCWQNCQQQCDTYIETQKKGLVPGS